MVHLRREHFLTGESNKLQSKKFGPYRILHKISDNAYNVNLLASWNISSTLMLQTCLSTILLMLH